MTVATVPSHIAETQSLLLNVTNTTLIVTSEQFDRLIIDNPDLRIELTQVHCSSFAKKPDFFGKVGFLNPSLKANAFEPFANHVAIFPTIELLADLDRFPPILSC
jgi:hypothetical protein